MFEGGLGVAVPVARTLRREVLVFDMNGRLAHHRRGSMGATDPGYRARQFVRSTFGSSPSTPTIGHLAHANEHANSPHPPSNGTLGCRHQGGTTSKPLKPPQGCPPPGAPHHPDSGHFLRPAGPTNRTRWSYLPNSMVISTELGKHGLDRKSRKSRIGTNGTTVPYATRQTRMIPGQASASGYRLGLLPDAWMPTRSTRPWPRHAGSQPRQRPHYPPHHTPSLKSR